jgi:putative ABC transport system ATP-binding protein
MIEIKNITKSYSRGATETFVLKGISFSIKEGEFVAIVGPSGSGKSTIMNILGALDAPTGGEYFLHGEDISKLSEDGLADIRKNKIGFVFQSFNLLPRATVFRNVMLPLMYTDMAPEEREEKTKIALRASGLDEELWFHLSNELSGGQMQRTAIARALVNNPAIILADEPTGNLDSKTGDLVLSAFKDLHGEGRTIILITHERRIAENAGRIISIKDGRIEEDRKI